MATACVISCDICTHDFNEADRKSVALPCGHDFCLTCLVRLKTSDGHKCPKCRGDWSALEVEVLPGMDDVKNEHQAENEFPGETWKKFGELCKKHELSFMFWSRDKKDFFCKKCVVENSYSKLELINEAIPQIKTDLSNRGIVVGHKIGKDFAKLDMMDKELVDKLRQVQVFKEELEKLERGITECIQQIQSLKAVNQNASIISREIVGGIKKINSDEDISMILDLRAALEHLSEPIVLPSVEESKSTLCNIACSYEEAAKSDGHPLEDTFICKLLKTSRTSVEFQTKKGRPDDPSSDAALIRELLRAPALSTELMASIGRAAKKLKEGSEWWNLDHSNCLAALGALAHKQPSFVILTAKPDEPLPAAAVAAVAKAIKGSQIKLRLLDSFTDHQNVNTDLEMLKHFVGNSSHRLTTFYGHLDAAGIALLPRTIETLGLVITSAADARAVSGLRLWRKLDTLVVTVNSGVAVQNLRALPRVRCTRLHFPGLTDVLVGSVRPAIEALVPARLLNWLCFPSCHLRTNGATLLAHQLQGIRVTSCVGLWTVGCCGLNEEARNIICSEFRSAVGCGVMFDFSWNLLN